MSRAINRLTAAKLRAVKNPGAYADGNGLYLGVKRNSFAAYVHPKVGDSSVKDITTENVLTRLQPIWHMKPETAARVRCQTARMAAPAVAILDDLPRFSSGLVFEGNSGRLLSERPGAAASYCGTLGGTCHVEMG